MSRGFWNIFFEGGEGLRPLNQTQEVYLDIFHMVVIVIGYEVGVVLALFELVEDFVLDV